MYKPTIMVGDVFQANNTNDYYGESKLIVTKVTSSNDVETTSPMPQPTWIESAEKRENQWVYFKVEPEIHSKTEDKCKFWWILNFCHRILTHDEESILLYAETCLVDYYGQMKNSKMNLPDMKALDRFKIEGLLDYGRIPFEEINKDEGRFANTHWVRFTNEAWALVHSLREERANRMLIKRYGTSLSPKSD